MRSHKGSIFTLLIIAIIGLTLSILYRNSRPESLTPLVAVDARSNTLADTTTMSYVNFEEVLLETDGEYYLWFCDTNDTNCSYVENEYIYPMLKTLGVESFNELQKVDFTDCNFTKAKLVSKYNVTNPLAFTKVIVEDGEVTFSDSLSYDESEPFTYEDLQQWLYDQNIWQTTYASKTEVSKP